MLVTLVFMIHSRVNSQFLLHAPCQTRDGLKHWVAAKERCRTPRGTGRLGRRRAQKMPIGALHAGSQGIRLAARSHRRRDANLWGPARFNSLRTGRTRLSKRNWQLPATNPAHVHVNEIGSRVVAYAAAP